MVETTNAEIPPPRIWTITNDPKAIEYKEKIHSQVLIFQRIAIGILMLLLLIYCSSFSYHQKILKIAKLPNDKEKLIKSVTSYKNGLKSLNAKYISDTRKAMEPNQELEDFNYNRSNFEDDIKSLNAKHGSIIQKAMKLKLDLIFDEIQLIKRQVNNLDLERVETIEQMLTKQKLIWEIDDKWKEAQKNLRDIDGALVEKSKETQKKSEAIIKKLREKNSKLEDPKENQKKIKIQQSINKYNKELYQLDNFETKPLQAIIYQLEKIKFQAIITKTRIDSEATTLKLELLKSEIIPFAALKFVGDQIKVEVPEGATFPKFLLPLIWSLLLFGFILFWERSRFSILTLYAGIVRRSLEIKGGITPSSDNLLPFLENNTEELMGTPQCGYWWLAPLPNHKGTCLRTTEFRAALGWKRSHVYKEGAVCVIGIILIIAQLELLVFGIEIFNLFKNEVWFRALLGVETVIVSVNILFIIFALAATIKIPDFGTNQEECIQLGRRNFFRFVIVFSSVSALGYPLYKDKIDSNYFLSKRNPRYRAKSSLHLDKSNTSLAQGFYQNSKTLVLHYLAPLKCENTIRRRNKRNRVPFKSQSEENLYIDKLNAWRRSGGLNSRPAQNRINPNGFYLPKLLRTNEFKNTVNFKCEGLVFLDASNISNIISIESDRIPNILKSLNNYSTAKLFSPKFQSKRFVFAVEQYVLNLLKDSTPLSDHQTEVKNACDLLLEAIELVGRETDSLRLFDFLAALSFRYKQTDVFEKLRKKAEDYGRIGPKYVDFSLRARNWAKPEGNWQKRWSSDKTIKIYKKYWANLPM